MCIRDSPTTVSRFVGAIVIFCMMFNPKREINFCGQVRFRFNGDLIKKILYIAIPNGMENSMFQLGKILVLSVVATMGTSAIAANAVSNTLASWNILAGGAILSLIHIYIQKELLEEGEIVFKIPLIIKKAFIYIHFPVQGKNRTHGRLDYPHDHVPALPFRGAEPVSYTHLPRHRMRWSSSLRREG